MHGIHVKKKTLSDVNCWCALQVKHFLQQNRPLLHNPVLLSRTVGQYCTMLTPLNSTRSCWPRLYFLPFSWSLLFVPSSAVTYHLVGRIANWKFFALFRLDHNTEQIPKFLTPKNHVLKQNEQTVSFTSLSLHKTILSSELKHSTVMGNSSNLTSCASDLTNNAEIVIYIYIYR
jgi:hypothetical protein